MDKYLRTIDMTEHPEKYTDKELREMLDDPETRNLYETLCDAYSALKPAPNLSDEDVEREWQRFMNGKMKGSARGTLRIMHIFGRRIAAATFIAITSVAALAVGVGFVMGRNSARSMPEQAVVTREATTVISCAGDTITGVADTMAVAGNIVFENETLGTILDDMADFYGLNLETDNNTLLNIRLFYRWDRSDSVEEVVRQLNNFEKINLKLSDGTLTLK